MAEIIANEVDGTIQLDGAQATAPAQGTIQTWTFDAMSAALQLGAFRAKKSGGSSTDEIVLVTPTSSTSASVTRGVDGTSTQTHADNEVLVPIGTRDGMLAWLQAQTVPQSIPINGWIPLPACTYASADAPTFTFTISGDYSAVIQAGNRIKITQTTPKYFLVTKVAFSGGTTTVTVYGGTDYTLANAAITSPYYSPIFAPFGFPLDPVKWTVELVDTSGQTQSSPVSGTWYNLGSLSISAPIGIWNAYYEVMVDGSRAGSGDVLVVATLSTANNTESDSHWTAAHRSALGTFGEATLFRKKTITATVKTSYFVNVKAGVASLTSINEINGTSPLIVRLVSAYVATGG